MPVVPHESRKKYLEQVVTEAEANLDLAGPYLTRRGITRDVAKAARLGVVSSTNPHPDLADMAGRLLIPYLTVTGPIALKFRCIRDHDCKETGCPKYMGEIDITLPLYNTPDLLRDEDYLFVTEGELDCLVVSKILNLPCVGYAGTAAWQRFFNRAITPDWLKIVVIADGDKPGRDAARETAKHLFGARVLKLPEGEDCSSLLLLEGPEALKKRLLDRCE